MKDPYMSSCILSKKTGDSDMTLVKDGLTINLLCEQATHEYSLSKKSFGSLMDVHVSVRLFDASLKTLGDLACHAKRQKLFPHDITQ